MCSDFYIFSLSLVWAERRPLWMRSICFIGCIRLCENVGSWMLIWVWMCSQQSLSRSLDLAPLEQLHWSEKKKQRTSEGNTTANEYSNDNTYSFIFLVVTFFSYTFVMWQSKTGEKSTHAALSIGRNVSRAIRCSKLSVVCMFCMRKACMSCDFSSQPGSTAQKQHILHTYWERKLWIESMQNQANLLCATVTWCF